MNPPALVQKDPDRLTHLAEGFRTGRLSVGSYARTLKGRFAEREASICAFVEEEFDRFEHLEAQVAAVQCSFPDHSSRPALFGIPVGVKDIFHVEGFPTRAGSRVPPEALKGEEAKVVSALRSVGAVVLGKTVTAEFAYFVPGPTRNPYNPGHTPGGSSSGSAAAVAAGLCPLALGTQTGGSILRPASFCGVVGYKPTYGRIPLEGVLTTSPSVDHVGFFTADIEGAMLAASVLCEGWKPTAALPPLVVGIPEGPYLKKASDDALAHFARVCNHLGRKGFKLRRIEMLDNLDEVLEHFGNLVAAETAFTHARLFSHYAYLYHPKTAELIMKGQGISATALDDSRGRKETLRKDIEDVMSAYNISALIAPAAVGPAPVGLDSTGDPIMNVPWSYAGLPAISIPCGFSKDGLPMGFQLVGTWMGDEILLHISQKAFDACADLQ